LGLRNPDVFSREDHTHPDYLHTDEAASDTDRLGGIHYSRFSAAWHIHPDLVPIHVTPPSASSMNIDGQMIHAQTRFAAVGHVHNYAKRGEEVSYTYSISSEV